MSISEAQVQSALKELIDPNTGKDFIATRSARNIRIDGTDVSVDIERGYPAKSQMDHLRRMAIAVRRAMPGTG